MSRTSLAVSFALLAALCACGGVAREATTRVGHEAWREDLRFLARELPRRHANAFHTTSREEFEAAVARLDSDLPGLNPDEALTGLMRVVALVGDGHTRLDLPPSWPRYPFEMHWFGGELRVVAAGAPHHAAVGARVVRIGERAVEDALASASRLVPRGENEARTRFAATQLLTSPEVLRGLGLADARVGGAATFLLEVGAGEQARVTPSPAPPGDFSGWRMAAGDAPPLYLQRLTEPWWAAPLPHDPQTVYFSFTRYPEEDEFRERAAALGRLLDASGARRLVIDLRRNEGGDFGRFRRHLLPVVRDRAAINRAGGLYVITGTGTFSAAAVGALDLRREAHATLVGEPTGIRPNHYGDRRDFRLPNTGLRVSYSTRLHRFGDDDTAAAVFPDQHVAPTWADFSAGRDPVMDWITSQPL